MSASYPLTQIGRLAMRREGTLWVAYYALNDTMEGALFLGSIRMVAVEYHPQRKETFMALMREMVSDILEQSTGQRPSWKDARPAPEHERGGQG